MEPPTQPTSNPLSLELDVDGPLDAGAPVVWRIGIVNGTGSTVTRTCPTAQLADVVLRSGNTEVYRWGEGRLFAQAMTELVVQPPGRTLELEEPALHVRPGSYEAAATLTCADAPPPAVTTVEVVPAGGGRRDGG